MRIIPAEARTTFAITLSWVFPKSRRTNGVVKEKRLQIQIADLAVSKKPCNLKALLFIRKVCKNPTSFIHRSSTLAQMNLRFLPFLQNGPLNFRNKDFKTLKGNFRNKNSKLIKSKIKRQLLRLLRSQSNLLLSRHQ